MISLWPHWQRPLFGLLLPILIYLLWKLWNIHELKGSWQALIPPPFQPWLLRGNSAQESILPKLLISLATLLTFFALLGPSWKHIEQPPLKIDAPLVIVIDMTPRMLSSDIAPNRLLSVKRKLIDIINTRKDAQTALIVYAGSAHVVAPLSDDKATLDNLINSLSPTIMPKQGERADLGIIKAIQLLDNTRQTSKTKRAKILLITTELSEKEQADIKKSLKGLSVSLDILGVGTAQGAPILVNGSFLKNQSGEIIIPKLDNNSLQQLAYSEGGYYSPITLNDSDIIALHLSNLTGDKRDIDETDVKTTDLWQDQGYWLLLPLLLIAAFAGRKGWLFCIPLLVITMQPKNVEAFEWDQLWLNKNQQGQKLVKQNQFAQAATRFQDKQWQGYAAYQAKDYTKAEAKFANAITPEEIYNYGNTLARQSKYKEAIAQWDRAIKEKPNFEQAIVNKKIVEDLLKQQQEQQQGKDEQSNNQEKNDQNSEQQQSGQPSEAQDQKNEPQQGKPQQNTEGEQQEADKNDADALSDPNDQQTDEQESMSKKDVQQAQQEKDNQQQDGEDNTKSASNTESINIHQQEQDESLKQQMRDISEDPSELLRRKFYYEQRYNKGNY